ncbi:hypothetical protein D3C87_2019550 [compost metagenome]
MQRLVAEAVGAMLFEIAGGGEETLGAQEEAVQNPLGRPDGPHEAMQGRMGRAGAELVLTPAALGVEAPGHGQGLD